MPRSSLTTRFVAGVPGARTLHAGSLPRARASSPATVLSLALIILALGLVSCQGGPREPASPIVTRTTNTDGDSVHQLQVVLVADAADRIDRTGGDLWVRKFRMGGKRYSLAEQNQVKQAFRQLASEYPDLAVQITTNLPARHERIAQLILWMREATITDINVVSDPAVTGE